MKPQQPIIDYFDALGFDFKTEESNIFIENSRLPIYYFQTKGADGIKYVSTILADDAVKLYKTVAEPLTKKVERTFGERCENGHLRALQPCAQCRKVKKEQPHDQPK